MSTGVHIARAEDLQRFAAGVFTAHGALPADANTVASALVKASLLGHDSHGLLRIRRYVDKIRQGALHPAAQPSVQRRHGATAIIDGGSGFGQLAGNLGADVAVELARMHGVAAVAISHTNHLGRLGDYAERISAGGLIALIFASGAGPGGSVAPYGGRERIMGTNPLAWSLPVPPGRGPLVADFSTSAIPEGRVAMAKARGEPIPAGTLLARDGRATLDPAEYYAGGALLPFGGHKGSSLVLLIELMASLLGGSVPATAPHYRPGNPAVMIALDVATFLSPDEFLRHTEALLRRIESSAPAEPSDRVLIPNSLELETATRRQRDGIPIPAALWTELQTLGGEVNVPWLA